MRGFHKPTLFTVLAVVVVLFILYHFIVRPNKRKDAK